MILDKRPFFSIVVPTRNRAPLLVDSALKSILRQTFDDFEIVVCDNASTDNTGEAVRSIQHPRIRYIRSDVWIPKEGFFQFSLKHARGKFSTLFFDDDALITKALEMAHAILSKVESDLLGYSRACVYHFPNWHEEWQRNVLTIPKYSGKLKVYDARRHLEVVYERMEILLETPMVTNAFYRTEFVNQLVAKYGRLFPHGHMGDYNTACFSLWNTKEYLYLDFPLAVFGHWKENTQAQLHDLQTTMPEYQEWIAWMKANYLSQMPIKSYTWLNCVAAALLDMKKRLRLPFDLNWVGYFIDVGNEIRALKKRGIDVSAQENDWTQSVKNLPPEDQKEITQGLQAGRIFSVSDRTREIDQNIMGEGLPPSLVGHQFKLFSGQTYGFQNILEASEAFEELAFHFAETFPSRPSLQAEMPGISLPARKGADDRDRRNIEVRASRVMKKQTEAGRDGIRDEFDAGNYALVAMMKDPNAWQVYAALGLVGKTQEAISGLSRFDGEEARFYSAVTHWIGGNEEAAIRLLERISTPHAQNLLRMIRKKKIRVLAQIPWRRIGPQDLLTGMASDSKFSVENISFHPADLQNEPYANIHKYYNPQEPPDFYICQMAEWHLIPPNIQELPCPILGQTADYDLHIQAIYPWLQVFDEMIVCDGDEWADVRRLVSVPVSTFPKSFCVRANLPLIFTGEREIDLFVSGTVKSPYNPDKSRLLNQVMRMPDIRVKVLQGYFNEDVYFQNLAHSKVTYTFTRRPSNTPTRGLDALAMGCALVVPRGNVLNLFVGEETGVLSYSRDGEDLPEAIYRIVRNWPDFEPRSRRGAEIIRREFGTAKVGSQYLRFATFLAARPRPPRPKIQENELDQRRLVKWKGWLPSNEAGELHYRLRTSNLSHWRRKWKGMDPHLINLIGREIFLSLEGEKFHTVVSPYQERVIEKTLRLYRICAAHCPKALVLKFNWVRNAFHFGNPREVSEALVVAGEMIAMPSEEWRLDVLDDVYTWDYANSFFNFRKYTDLVTEHLMTGSSVASELVRLILAAVHHYLGHYTQSLEHFQAAVSLDPDFPIYRLMLAQALMRRAGKKDLEEAAALLRELAKDSILDFEAYHLLLELEPSGLVKRGEAIQIRAMLDRMYESVLIKEPIFSSSSLQPAMISKIAQIGMEETERGETESSEDVVLLLDEIINYLQSSSYGRKFTGIPFASWGQARLGVAGPADQLALLKQQAISLHEKGKAAESERIFREVLAVQPNDIDSLVSLGRICFDRKLFAQSLQHLRRSANLNPGDGEIWIGIALNAIQTRDSETFELARRNIRRLAPRHSILKSLDRVMIKGEEGPWDRPHCQRHSAGISARSGKPIPPVIPIQNGRHESKGLDTHHPVSEQSRGVQPTPIVSAIVSTYNAERFIRGLLEDLERQTIADRLEIVVIDSHSQQNEKAIVEEFQKRFDNIVYLRTDQRENSHVAFNRAVHLARGKYLTLANTDDRHRVDAFERMVQVLEAHPDVALVYADVAITSRENEIFENAEVRGYYRWPDFDPKLLFQICYIGPQPMWRREIHDRYGYFDPEFISAGDYEFWLRLAQKEKFLHIPEVLGLYYLSAHSNEHKNMSLNFQESEKARDKYWPKEWGKRPTPFFNQNPFAFSATLGEKRIPSPEQLLNLRQQAVHFYNQGDCLGAKNAFKLALTMDPDDPNTLVSLGRICLDSKDYQEALEYLLKATQKDASDKDAWLGLALAAEKLNDPSLMKRAYEKVHPLDRQEPALPSATKLLRKKEGTMGAGESVVIPQPVPDPIAINEWGEDLDPACRPARPLVPKNPSWASLSEGAQEHRSDLAPAKSLPSFPKTAVGWGSLRVLLIQLEIPSWVRARSWSYASQLGIEEGFLANNVEFMTLLAFSGIPSSDSRSWLGYARKLCCGKRFDQVWVEIVHSDLEDDFLEWLSTLAPVRIGYIAESLRYDPEEWAIDASFQHRWVKVQRRLHYLTHALVIDEKDAEDLNAQTRVRAMWCPAAVPKRYLSESIPEPQKPYALFCGALYGEREAWLRNPELRECLLHIPPPEEGTPYPGSFDRLIQLGFQLVREERFVNGHSLNKYLNGLRKIRRHVFALWVEALQQGCAVVNLPHLVKAYSGRVVEGMAAGRPVISWEIPNRPLNKALFEEGKEILLFPKENPSALVAHIQRITKDPSSGRKIAERALRKIRESHTMEKRVEQVLQWVETGETVESLQARVKGKANKEKERPKPLAVKEAENGGGIYQEQVQNFIDCFTKHPEWSGPHPNADEEARWKKISAFLEQISKFREEDPAGKLRMLDLGCGRGWLTNLASSYGVCEGIDPIPEVVEQACRLFPHLHFYTGTGQSLLARSEFRPYDVVIASEIIEHIPRDQRPQFAHDLSNLLKPKGYLIVTTPRREVFEVWNERIAKKPESTEDWLTEEEVRRLFVHLGFRSIGSDRVYYEIPSMTFKLAPGPTDLESKDLIPLYQIWLFEWTRIMSPGG